MEIDCIIQARMSSSRLPGKVLYELGGQPLLKYLINRLENAESINRIIVATSTDDSDDLLCDFCADNNIEYFRGSLDDVLSRYYETAKLYESKNILRITGDCPLIDYRLIDFASKNFIKESFDLYGLGGEFPDGLDFTFFTFESLERAHLNANLPSEREHICLYMEKNETHIGAFRPFCGMEWMRLTVDEPDDLSLLEELFSLNRELFKLSIFEIIDMFNTNIELKLVNSNILRNEGLIKSQKNETV